MVIEGQKWNAYLVLATQLGVTMCKVAPIAFHAVLVLLVVLAQGCLVEVVELLAARLRLVLHGLLAVLDLLLLPGRLPICPSPIVLSVLRILHH